jgi:hypothetical protein
LHSPIRQSLEQNHNEILKYTERESQFIQKMCYSGTTQKCHT